MVVGVSTCRISSSGGGSSLDGSGSHTEFLAQWVASSSSCSDNSSNSINGGVGNSGSSGSSSSSGNMGGSDDGTTTTTITTATTTTRATTSSSNIWLVSWCFESSQPQGIISGLKTRSLSYSARMLLNVNHNFSATQLKHFTKRSQLSGSCGRRN